MNKYTDIENETATSNETAERYVLEMIRREHPQWVEEDGGCALCDEFYRALNRIIKITPDSTG